MKPKYIIALAAGTLISSFAVPYFTHSDHHKDLDARCERHASWTDGHWWHGWHTSWTCPNGEVVFD